MLRPDESYSPRLMRIQDLTTYTLTPATSSQLIMLDGLKNCSRLSELHSFQQLMHL